LDDFFVFNDCLGFFLFTRCSVVVNNKNNGKKISNFFLEKNNMRILFILLTISWMGLLALLGFLPNHFLSLYLPIQNDKVLHFFGFLILTMLVYYCWELSTVYKNIMITSFILFIISVVSEIVQGLFTFRVFDVQDIIMNLLGSFCGIVLTLVFDKFKDFFRKKQSRSTQDYVLLNDVSIE
jgi:glycopeptide antibiotics resistance protein